jgi:hypothetical protein
MAPKGAKAKKKEPDHDELDHEALLATIEETGDLPNDVKLHLLRCDQPLCPPGCKGGRKDNPKCFCGMIPEEGHFKRVGLFSKTPAVLGSLGVDPATQRRAVRGFLCCVRFVSACFARCVQCVARAAWRGAKAAHCVVQRCTRHFQCVCLCHSLTICLLPPRLECAPKRTPHARKRKTGPAAPRRPAQPRQHVLRQRVAADARVGRRLRRRAAAPRARAGGGRRRRADAVRRAGLFRAGAEGRRRRGGLFCVLCSALRMM